MQSYVLRDLSIRITTPASLRVCVSVVFLSKAHSSARRDAAVFVDKFARRAPTVVPSQLASATSCLIVSHISPRWFHRAAGGEGRIWVGFSVVPLSGELLVEQREEGGRKKSPDCRQRGRGREKREREKEEEEEELKKEDV